MELLLLIGGIVMVIVGLLGGLHKIPFGRWSFTLEGRRVEVVNYVMTEKILVDGEHVPHTRVAGDHMTHATHALALPDGRQLDVRIGSDNGLTVRCVATVDGEVLFDSQDPGSLGIKARAQLPGHLESPEPEAPEIVDDHRWDAASILLDELSQEAVLAPTVQELSEELRRAMHRLAQARNAAQAHQALGGSEDELGPAIRAHEEAVEARLALLRRLHLVASSPAPTEAALPDVRDALDRLQTERELEAVESEAHRLARARSSEAQQG